MKVDVAAVNDVERRMTVEVPSDSVTTEIDKAYRELKKKVTLKGFRPGKTPVSILEKHFKAQVEEDVINRLVQQTYPQALEEAKIAPVSQPKIENSLLEKGKDFSYTAVVEIKPELAPQGYEGLELEKLSAEVSDEDVDREIEQMRERCATLKDIEGRPVQRGDQVVFDFEGTFDGQPFAGGKKTDFSIRVEDQGFLPGFADHLIGMNIGGEKDFSLTLPEDYQDKEIAGKTIEFHVLLKNIKEKILPVLDDEFAKDLGTYSSLADLKDNVRQDLITRKQNEADSDLRQKIFDALIEKNDFEVPQGMVDMQAQNMVKDMQQRFEAQGVRLEDIGQSPQQLAEQYKKTAERQVRSALLLEAIAQKEGLEAEQEDYDKKYEELAQMYSIDTDTIKEKVSRDMILPQILERKALDLIISKADIKNIKAEQQKTDAS